MVPTLAVLAAVRPGRTVIANVSRAVIEDALERVMRVRVIEITAPPELLAQRLAARGRESADSIAERPVGVSRMIEPAYSTSYSAAKTFCSSAAPAPSAAPSPNSERSFK